MPVPVAIVCGRCRSMYSAAQDRLASAVGMDAGAKTNAASYRQQVLCCLLDALHDCQAHDIVYECSLGSLHLQVPQGGEHQAARGAGPHIAAPPCTSGCGRGV